MYVLGIHDGHNASAALLQDGRVIAAVQEERPRGLKNALGMLRAAVQDRSLPGRSDPGRHRFGGVSGLA